MLRLTDGTQEPGPDVDGRDGTGFVPEQKPPARRSAGVASASRRPHGRATAALGWADANPFALVGGGAVVAVLAFFTRLTQSPDYTLDEVLYVLAGQNVANHGSVSWDGSPILVHPPLFFSVVGGWLALTGHANSDPVPALMAARGVSACFDVVLVVLVGLAARAWLGPAGARRGLATSVAMLLALTNPFLLRFGRAVLIEPMVVTLAVATLLVAWQLRNARTARYVVVVGVLVGLTLLTKAPSVFLLTGPALAELLRRDVRRALRHVAAVAAGAFVWLAFPLWAALNGRWGQFSAQQGNSIERLVGLLQVTGFNRTGVSPASAFTTTLGQYAPGYFVFGLALVALLLHGVGWLTAGRRLGAGAAFTAGSGICAFAFLGYSVVFGQANEQLSVYVVPSSALLVASLVTAPAVHRRIPRALVARAAVTLGTVGVLAGFASAGTSVWTVRDSATRSVAAFVTEELPRCAGVNATGDDIRWFSVLRENPVTIYGDGPSALAAGVHVFLLSPKDATFRYGVMTPEFGDWIVANGTEVFSEESHTYGRISVYVVGQLPVADDDPGCAFPIPAASTSASAPLFAGLTAATSGILLAGGALAERRRPAGRPAHRRRRRRGDA